MGLLLNRTLLRVRLIALLYVRLLVQDCSRRLASHYYDDAIKFGATYQVIADNVAA